MTLSKKILSTALCVSAFALISPDARAGFDWTPPPRQSEVMHGLNAVPSQASEETGPLTPEPDAALPVPVENVQSQTLPTAQAAAPVEELPAPVMETPEKVPSSETTPIPLSFEPLHKQLEEMPVPPVLEIMQEATKVTPEPVPVSTEAPAAANAQAASQVAPQEPVLEGFGSDISLALALRDIVPPSYAYAFKNSSDAGLKVSWQGGKVWQEVLKDALAPYKLTFAVVDNAVYIYSVEEQAEPQSAAPAEPRQVTAPAPEPMVSYVDSPKEQAVPPVQIVEQPKEPAVSAVVPVMNASLSREWAARPGATLRQTIEDWGKAASVEIEWRSPYDYPINSPFSFNGTFNEAVESLLSQYTSEKQPPRGRLYPNQPSGPSVLMMN